MSSADLVVLGAGPASLVAARTGLSTVVLDRTAAVGGMAASFGGQLFTTTVSLPGAAPVTTFGRLGHVVED